MRKLKKKNPAWGLCQGCPRLLRRGPPKEKENLKKKWGPVDQLTGRHFFPCFCTVFKKGCEKKEKTGMVEPNEELEKKDFFGAPMNSREKSI